MANVETVYGRTYLAVILKDAAKFWPDSYVRLLARASLGRLGYRAKGRRLYEFYCEGFCGFTIRVEAMAENAYLARAYAVEAIMADMVVDSGYSRPKEVTVCKIATRAKKQNKEVL